MFGIPSNVLPLFIIGVVAIVFGVRSFYHYIQIKTPLTFYYGLSALFFGLAGVLYSLPFALSNSNVILKITVTLADIAYYLAILATMKIIWYLGFKKKISYNWLFWPTIILSTISFIYDFQYRINSTYYSANNIAYFPVSAVSLKILALISLSTIVVGILTLLQMGKLTKNNQKIRIFTLGSMYLIAGLTVEYNFLFLQGSNTSMNIVLGYSVATLGFILGLFFVRRKK